MKKLTEHHGIDATKLALQLKMNKIAQVSNQFTNILSAT
jgi:hypothetical protein